MAKKIAEIMWMRRIVPAGYVRATLILTGTSPLLMSCSSYDRDSSEYRAYYLLGQKKRKSLDDEARLRELEWGLRFYLDEKVGPFIPGGNVKELLREAATRWRKGEEIVRSLEVIDYRIPLLYEGPREQDELWKAGFKYEAMVSNAGAGSGRVLRCRPKFEGWSLVVEIAYDPEDLDFDLLELVVERTKKFGLGDGRKIGFGQFEAVLEQGEVHKLGSNGSALKPIVREHLAAHIAILDRIMVGATT